MRVPKAADMSGAAHGVSVLPTCRANNLLGRRALAAPLKFETPGISLVPGVVPFTGFPVQINASMSKLAGVAPPFCPAAA